MDTATPITDAEITAMEESAGRAMIASLRLGIATKDDDLFSAPRHVIDLCALVREMTALAKPPTEDELRKTFHEAASGQGRQHQ